jgi:hypothetical protein
MVTRRTPQPAVSQMALSNGSMLSPCGRGAPDKAVGPGRRYEVQPAERGLSRDLERVDQHVVRWQLADQRRRSEPESEEDVALHGELPVQGTCASRNGVDLAIVGPGQEITDMARPTPPRQNVAAT